MSDEYYDVYHQPSSSPVIKFFGQMVIALFLIAIGISIGYFTQDDLAHLIGRSNFTSPFVEEHGQAPLNAYSIPNLAKQNIQASQIKVGPVTESTSTFERRSFSYTTLDKTMTGQLTIPKTVVSEGTQPQGVIVMLRGYVAPEIYEPGVGTRNGAAAFAEAGYLTVAPDFFDYGESDPEFEDTWKARFVKPVSVAELIASIRENGLEIPTDQDEITVKTDAVGIWAHSNGGQIALTMLEITGESIPTTLWAPVTAPFPYSILYFGDELADEGKEQRKWISLFEEDYDALDFSLTQHLNLLNAPLQIHQGTNDDAVLKWWSDEFTYKLDAENSRRDVLAADPATATSSAVLDEIEYEYFIYPDADHNMQPGWGTAIRRDIEFFDAQLSNQVSTLSGSSSKDSSPVPNR